MTSKTDSWKDKIDPAFDKFIKFYLLLLETCQLPANEGYLSMQLPESCLKKLEIEGFPSIALLYEHDNAEDASFDFISMLDDTITMQDFKKATRKIAKEIKKDEYSLYEIFLALADQLQEKESKDYYLKKYKYLMSDDGYKIHMKSLSEVKQKKWRKEFYSDWQSLQWNHAVNVVEHVKESIDDKRKIIVRRFNEQPKIFRRSIFFLWNTISMLINKKGIKSLLVEARKGDDKSDDSLFKLLQIDKTLFDHDWVRARIRKASYFADWDFFDKMSKAIKTDPLKNRKVHGDVFLILIHLWTVGLYRLTIPELMQLFKISGVRMVYDEINFRKFIDREIKPLFIKWSAL
jgi:hypothetical protein